MNIQLTGLEKWRVMEGNTHGAAASIARRMPGVMTKDAFRAAEAFRHQLNRERWADAVIAEVLAGSD